MSCDWMGYYKWSFQNYNIIHHQYVNLMEVKISSLTFESLDWIAVLESYLLWIHIFFTVLWLFWSKKQFLDSSSGTVRFIIWSSVEEMLLPTSIWNNNSKVKYLTPVLTYAWFSVWFQICIENGY